jgi:phage shock protein A
VSNATSSRTDQAKFDKHVAKLDGNIKTLRSNVKKYENELRTLKARAKVAKATKNINKQLADVDSSSTVSMLERMKDKVAEEESLAESYADIASESTSVDDEIEKALNSGSAEVKASDSLAALKAKLAGND